jgi:ribosomal protein S10
MPLPPYKISSKSTNQFKIYAHLRRLNVCHFGMVEATRLSSMDSMSSPPYKIESKSTNQFKSCTHHRSLDVCHFGMVEAMGLNSM